MLLFLLNKNGGVSYKYANAASATRVYFSEENPTVLLVSGKDKLGFSLVDSENVAAQIGSKGNEYKFSEFDLRSENCITYPNVYKGADLVYSANNGYLKEYIVLADASAPTEFYFEFDTKNYCIKKNDTGTLNVYNADGELVFEFGSLFAVDSADNYTDELKYEIVETKEDTTIVGVSVDRAYLNDPNRVFPVLIDPSVMVTGADCTYDTYVSSRYPTTNYYLYNWLRTGRDEDYYTRRTYIKFDLPTGIASSSITSAYINLKYYSGSTPTVKAYRTTGSWSSSTLTWNNMPGYTKTNASANASLYSNNWYRLYVTNIVKSWRAGTYSNYGFMLKDDTESGTSHWTTFYSSDAASPNKPELNIYYNPPTVYYGSRPYQEAPAGNASNCMGYALEYKNYITGAKLGVDEDAMAGKTTAQMLSYIKGKSQTWMNTYIGSANYASISAYNSNNCV